MKTLIIFLLLFLVFILIIALFSRIKIKFDLQINNFDINYDIKVAFFNFAGKLKLEEKSVDIKKQIELNVQNKNINFEKIKQITEVADYDTLKFKKLIKYTIRAVEINYLNINVKIGLLFMIPTILSVQIFSILIPLIYNIPFKKKKKLNFNVLPIFETLKFNLNLNCEFLISGYNAIFLFIMWKKIKNE